MKNMKKLLQRAMVFTLTAAMLVGTPMTASAAGLVDLYSVSDGTGQVGEGADPSHTGTVTNTDTNSHSGVLKDNDASIIGIVLDKDYVNAEVGKKETLTATVIFGGALKDGVKKDADIVKEIESKIKWEVLYANGDTSKNGVAANQVLSISADAANRTVVTLNPRQGTLKGEEMIVKATIDGSYWFYLDEDGNIQKENIKDGKSYSAEADVFIKEYSKSLTFKELPKAFIKHTVNLNDYLVRTPATANDDITWISSNAKATVTAAGVVTFKKAGEVTITAVGERGAKATATFDIQAGTPASKVEILDGDAVIKSTTTDLNTALPDGWGSDTKDVTVRMYAKVKGYRLAEDGEVKGAVVDSVTGKAKMIEVPDGDLYVDENKTVSQVEVTDVITWTSNKVAIASVAGDSESAEITAKGVGKATITAKATSGKKATLSVTVKATLSSLEITNKETELYTGQSLQMTYEKTPEQSKDAVAWSIAKVENENGKAINNPNASINGKGVLTIKPKLNENYSTVTVVLKSKKKVPTGATGEDGKAVSDYISAEKTINLAQSDITGITVTEAGKTIATATIENKKLKKNVGISKADNTSILNVPKSGTYNVEVVGAGGADSLVWKSSNAKVAEITSTGDQVQIKAIKNGSATITVSGVYNNKANAIKTTFKVTVQQPIKTVTLNKTSVVINQKDKKNVPQNQSVSFKATLGPKGYKKEAVTWTVDCVKGDATIANGKLTMVAPVVGDEFKVTASVPTGAKATATVKVLAKTTGVAIAQEPVLAEETQTPVLFETENKKGKLVANTEEVVLGESFVMYPFVNVSAVKKGNDWHAAGTDNCEDVTYSVNKKGIVSIASDGTVYGIKPGTVKITAKTPTGQKTTLTVTVNVKAE